MSQRRLPLITFLLLLPAPAVAQVLPPAAQPQAEALARQLQATGASLDGAGIRLEIGRHRVRLTHSPARPWFRVDVTPNSEALRVRVVTALAETFERDPWLVPPPPSRPPRPLLAELPDVRHRSPAAAGLASALVALVGLVGLGGLVRRSR